MGCSLVCLSLSVCLSVCLSVNYALAVGPQSPDTGVRSDKGRETKQRAVSYVSSVARLFSGGEGGWLAGGRLAIMTRYVGANDRIRARFFIPLCEV